MRRRRALSLAVIIAVASIAVAPLITVLQTHSGRSSVSTIVSAVIAFAVLAVFATLLASGLGPRAPVELAVNERELKVHIRGIDRVWALHGGFVVPLAHVVSVDAAADEAARGPRGLRMPGTGLPGFIVAGTYVGAQTEFWDVHDPRRAIALTLRGERFARLVVHVDDPSATIAALRAEITRASGDTLTSA
jgi:hypothetical protein